MQLVGAGKLTVFQCDVLQSLWLLQLCSSYLKTTVNSLKQDQGTRCTSVQIKSAKACV